MKICVIGNSHVGALKRAWDEIKGNYPQQRIIFFAQRGDGLEELAAHNGKLTPNNEELTKSLEFTSGGSKEIAPEDYDMFVIYGVGATAYFIDNNQFYSRSAMQRALHDILDPTLSFKLLKRLRSITDKKIFVGHCPLPAAKEVASNTRPNAYIAGLKLINDIIYHPLNAELIGQPLSTIVNEKHTHPDLSKDSKRLAIGDNFDNENHPANEDMHMNDKFGEMWLREFLEKAL